MILKSLKSILNRIRKLLPISQKATLKSIVKTMKHYDMFKDENEQFFYSVYMHFIEKKVHEIFGERNIKILDAGCGQGRLTIPLAKNGHQVTGMDLSPDVINLAEKYAKDANVTIELLTGNIEEDLIKFSPQQFDCVICLEVLYMLKNYKSIISNLVKLVKPGGLIILSLRPKLFYVLYTIMNGNFNEAAKLVLHEENYINSMQLNCLTRAEMIDLLSTNGINNIETNGIGILSGIEGDPQARFVVPSKINKKDTEILYQMELKLSEKYCDNARYILVSGVKS